MTPADVRALRGLLEQIRRAAGEALPEIVDIILADSVSDPLMLTAGPLRAVRRVQLDADEALALLDRPAD